MTWAIRVNHLSKMYRHGSLMAPVDTFYQKVNQTVRALFKREPVNQEVIELQPNSLVLNRKQMQNCPANHFWALKDVSFEINQGDRIALVGKNGSGKSTLLKILSRITTPSEGYFEYQGRLISLLEVGTGFHPDLTGRENIFLNAKINGMSQKHILKVIDHMIEFSELGEHINTPIKRYSSGMYMRLAFSVAAFLESEILIVDEVLAVGDSSFQKKCLDKMLEITNQGRTLIFVSHDMNVVSNLCNKALELSHGKIVECDERQYLGDGMRPVSSVVSNYLLNKKIISKTYYENSELSVDSINSIHLYKFYINATDKNPQETFSFDDDLEFNFEFQSKKIGKSYQFNIYINTLLGQKLLNCNDIVDIECSYQKASVKIPKGLLNKGEYRVSLKIISRSNETDLIHLEDVLSFKISYHSQDFDLKYPLILNLNAEKKIQHIHSNQVGALRIT
jgi:lipopolysaccharide transport system ATP-binding protein